VLLFVDGEQKIGAGFDVVNSLSTPKRLADDVTIRTQAMDVLWMRT
jgi:hypothetical protein